MLRRAGLTFPKLNDEYVAEVSEMLMPSLLYLVCVYSLGPRPPTGSNSGLVCGWHEVDESLWAVAEKSHLAMLSCTLLRKEYHEEVPVLWEEVSTLAS